MKKNMLVGLLFSSLVAGCATTYDTEKSDWIGGRGFSQTQLENDVWQINFTGNVHTDTETRKKYILKKAALITIKEKYSFFKVIQSEVSEDNTEKDYTEGHASIYGRGRSNQRNIHTNTFTKMKVKLLKEKENLEGVIYDANLLVNTK